MASDIAWVGNWRNQFGSILRITDDANGRIEGNFETALDDSGFFGQAVPVTGFHRGNCIAFVAVGSSVTGDRAVSYTGLLRHGKMETAWFVIADQGLERVQGRRAGKAEASELVARRDNECRYVRAELALSSRSRGSLPTSQRCPKCQVSHLTRHGRARGASYGRFRWRPHPRGVTPWPATAPRTVSKLTRCNAARLSAMALLNSSSTSPNAASSSSSTAPSS